MWGIGCNKAWLPSQFQMVQIHQKIGYQFLAQRVYFVVRLQPLFKILKEKRICLNTVFLNFMNIQNYWLDVASKRSMF